MRDAWQKTIVVTLSMMLLFCYGEAQQKIPETVTSGPSQEISLFRQQIIAAIKDKQVVLLKRLYDSSKNIRYEKNLLLAMEEKRMLALLSDDFLFLVNENGDINDVAYPKLTKKNKTVYVMKVRPKKDELTEVLKKAVANQYPETMKTIAANNSLTDEEKGFLNVKTTMLFAYSAYNKKEPLQLLDDKLLLFKKRYPGSRFKDQIKYIEKYSLTFKRDVFFGGGLSVGKFNNGVQHLFTTPVNYHINFDLYTKRIGWYLSYNITAWGFKNKVDTMFNDKRWPVGTKNFVSEFQAGFGYVAVKTNYIRAIVRVGMGSFVMRPQKSESYEDVKKIKLSKFPVFSLGGCIDIGNFRLKFIDKHNTGIGVRLFYQYSFLGFKDKYPQFPTDIQNLGIQVGLMF